jgi:hypothetical protein
VVRNAGEIGQIKRDHTPQPPTGNSKSGNVGDNFSGLLRLIVWDLKAAVAGLVLVNWPR